LRYTLRQIEVFLATANHQNITAAAADLNMSQSAASSSLKDLESQFDTQLFDRVGKRLQINANGQQLRQHAENLMACASQLENQLAGQADIGLLHVGATLTIGNYLAVPIAAQYMQQGGQAEIKLNVANTESIVNQVLNYELDIGLIEGEYNHPQLNISQWQPDKMVIVAHPEHRFANQVLDDQKLIELDWISRELGSGTRQAFEHALHGLVPQLKVKMELQHTEAIKRAVESNLGVACLSELAVRDAIKRGSLCQLKAPQRNFERNFYFVTHKQKTISVSLNNWIELCRAQAST